MVREALEEDIELSKIVAERDVDGAEVIRAEDVDWDKVLSAEAIKDEEREQKYDIVYSKDVLEKDFPALPPTIKSRIKKTIDEELTTDPMKVGRPLRGKSEED